MSIASKGALGYVNFLVIRFLCSHEPFLFVYFMSGFLLGLRFQPLAGIPHTITV